ncbi:hypothetical protein BUALT_Bualt13G0007500 [Buddleja alternifolia]|uniref:DOG1 domain-containing protein n=1 Tax=Buddleja alternifolia TaxID=168488 RepID=A0AAV6WJG6_9LAMI|nr:hypothetical protein BUALT_Bualt13G0007500 [Buddleja alternifolia]
MAAINSAFISFFEDWIIKQEAFLEQIESILSSIDSGFNTNQECIDIIPRIFAHYREFYEEKAKVSTEDVFLLLSPPWMSSFERSMLWISGFRPSFLFPIIGNSIAAELSDDQKRRIEIAKSETRRKEREITQAMARVQETVAEPPIYSLMRNFGKLVDGEVGKFDAAVEEMKAAMVVVVRNADDLRWSTAGKVVEVLSPVQNVKFLAALARFQLRARRWGLEKDSQRETGVAFQP